MVFIGNCGVWPIYFDVWFFPEDFNRVDELVRCFVVLIQVAFAARAPAHFQGGKRAKTPFGCALSGAVLFAIPGSENLKNPSGDFCPDSGLKSSFDDFGAGKYPYCGWPCSSDSGK
ncbi:hypothetical protein [Vibrio aerogenes]|uniref:hypothetical protein n=1 Tax=Vibrio aerogenes TaxID=92172 RepID=UPI0021C29134|nr:hypothetical protein [Vibrio aerogenes]